MARPLADPDGAGRLPANRAVLDRILDGAERSPDGVGPWSPDGWIMRTHPDLEEALRRAATGTGLSLAVTHGLATLLDPTGLIAAVGWGTGRVWLRVADRPPAGSDPEGWGAAIDGLPGFVAVDAWQVPLADRVAATALALGAARGTGDA